MNHIEHCYRFCSHPSAGGLPELKVADYCVDGKSFEERLRAAFPVPFSKGRYREIQIPTLTGGLDDPADLDAVIENILPSEGGKRICPIYRCHDGCCHYAYVEVHNRGIQITWTRFELNKAYTNKAGRLDSDIEWLQDFEPLHFAQGDYQAMLAAFKAHRATN